MTTATKGILLAGLLGACQTENDNALIPQTPATVSDRNAKTASTLLLIKDGFQVLEYTTQGRTRLWKEINPGANKYRAYTYTASEVTGYQSFIGSSSKAFPSHYYLDANGRCEESSAFGINCKYEYTAQDQLKKCYLKGSPNERIEFTYNASGNLSLINYFDLNNKNTRAISFSYGGSPSDDKTPLNPEALCDFAGVSKYLPLFGTFSTKLITSLGDKTIPWNGSPYVSTYGYDFESGGYVKTMTINKPDGSIFSTERKYNAPLAD